MTAGSGRRQAAGLVDRLELRSDGGTVRVLGAVGAVTPLDSLPVTLRGQGPVLAAGQSTSAAALDVEAPQLDVDWRNRRWRCCAHRVLAGGIAPAGRPARRDAELGRIDAGRTCRRHHGSACGTIAPDYGQLVGVRVSRGYRDAIRRLFGRTAGCTHMNELAGVMGSAVLQAMWNELTQNADEQPFGIDGCHALKSSGPQVAQFFPRWYRPSPEGG